MASWWDIYKSNWSEGYFYTMLFFFGFVFWGASMIFLFKSGVLNNQNNWTVAIITILTALLVVIPYPAFLQAKTNTIFQ